MMNAFGYLSLGILVPVAVFWFFWYRSRSRRLVMLWASTNGYELLSLQLRPVNEHGPFVWQSDAQHVYFVTLRDKSGQSGQAYIRVGVPFFGVFSDRIEVIWDRTPPATPYRDSNPPAPSQPPPLPPAIHRPKSSRRFIITLAVGVGMMFLVMVLFLVSWLRQQAERQAITKVYAQQSAAFDTFKREKKPLLMSLAVELRSIDISDCPEDFRKRYSSAIDALDMVVQKTMASALDRAARMDSRKLVDDEKAVDAALSKFQAAMQSLNECAKSHGVSLHPAFGN